MIPLDQDKIILRPLLNLKYVQDQGLLFNWNLRGIKVQKTYNYHYFIFGESADQGCFRFLYSFYQQMPLGDIIGIVKKSSHSPSSIKIKKYQKIMNQDLPKNLSIQKRLYFDEEDMPSIFKNSYNQFVSKKGIAMINIMLGSYKNRNKTAQILHKDLQPIIKQLKSCNKQKNATSFNIIHKKPISEISNRIDIETGVNMFSRIQNNQQNPLISLLKQYCASINIASIKVKLKIATPNTFFGYSNAHGWKPVDFVTYQKQAYSLSNKSYQQKIIFLINNHSYKLDIKFNIQLVVYFANGAEMHCNADININQRLQKILSKTSKARVDEDRFQRIYIADQMIQTNLCEQIHIMCIQNVHKSALRR